MSKKPLKKKKMVGGIAGLIIGLGAFAGWVLMRMNPTDRAKLVGGVELRTKTTYQRLRNYFIPHEDNNYAPHVFQKRSVRSILLIALLVKVATVSVLFIVYPNEARLIANVQQSMYELINDYRTGQNQPALTPHAYLETIALAKANDMVANNYFSHFGLDGKKPWEWIDTGTYDFKAMGENLAMDFITAPAVVKAFQASPAHDMNLVSEKYSDIGIGIASGIVDGHQTNIMVVFFAAPRAVSPRTAVAIAPAAVEPVNVPVESPNEPPAPVETVPPPDTTPVTTPVATPPDVTPEVQPVPPIESTILPIATSTPVENIRPTSTFATVEPVEPTDVLGESIGVEPPELPQFDMTVVTSQRSSLHNVLGWVDRFMVATLMALIALLMINIAVKVRIQHASIIGNGLFLIVVVSALLYVNVHSAEAVGEQVKILAAFL